MNEDGLRADRELDRRIGEILRTIRQSRKMSMETVGGQIGVTYQQIQKYERGANRIPGSTLYRLAKILRVGLGVFFEGLGGDEVDREVRPGREDVEAAHALDRIEDPVVKDALRSLLEALDNTPSDV